MTALQAGGADEARTDQKSRFLSNTQFNSEAVCSPCLGDFRLAVVSFTDGFAAANYKFVSNSFSDALKGKKTLRLPLQIINSQLTVLPNGIQNKFITQLRYPIEYQVNEKRGSFSGQGGIRKQGYKAVLFHFYLPLSFQAP